MSPKKIESVSPSPKLKMLTERDEESPVSAPALEESLLLLSMESMLPLSRESLLLSRESLLLLSREMGIEQQCRLVAGRTYSSVSWYRVNNDKALR